MLQEAKNVEQKIGRVVDADEFIFKTIEETEEKEIERALKNTIEKYINETFNVFEKDGRRQSECSIKKEKKHKRKDGEES